jgi:hypothetical protein
MVECPALLVDPVIWFKNNRARSVLYSDKSVCQMPSSAIKERRETFIESVTCSLKPDADSCWL